MLRTKSVAAVSALLGLIAAAVVTIPAQAAPAPGSVTIDFEDSTLGGWQQNGSPTLAYVADPDNAENTVLSVSGRTSGYFGIQSPVGAFDEGVAYTITAKVRTAGTSGAAHFTYNEPGADNEYSWVGNTSTGTDSAWKTVTGTFTPGAGADSAKIYFEVEGLLDYLVDDITVTYLSECTDGPEPGTVVVSTGFEEGLDGWVKRDNGTGDFSLERVDTDAHDGDYSALVSERVSQGNGIGHDLTGLIEAGAQYEFTAWVKLADASSDRLWLSMRVTNEGSDAYNTLGQFTGLAGGQWHQVTATFSAPSADGLFLYLETPYASGEAGDTTDFYVDDISLVVPEPPVVQDLTPIKSTVDFPVGVAIDQRETLGAPSELLLKHFDQITPENYMKPEAWYNADGEWDPNSAQIDSLMDFAKANDIRVYGHVLVWHSQTPAWFFQDDEGNPLTNSEGDKQILRDRMRDHINNVADYLAQWGDFGDGNPITAFDVVNEVIDDSSAYADGMRRSEWYRILGEEFVTDAFEYAESAFNQGEHTAAGVDRPVKLFINDYNTEQSGKRGRYLALVDRLLAADVPVDGIGHQFHVSLSMPVSAMDEALTDASTRGLLQAVTELDVPTGTPESAAKFIDQGYYYRDAFEIFRAHAEQLYSVTVWGLNDARSWRDSSGGPLVFDDGFQAKPAYYGIVEPSGEEDPLPARLRTANSFAGDIAATAEGAAAGDWKLLPLLSAGENAGFQTRWADDHLTVFVDVDDAVANDGDGVTVFLGDAEYFLPRSGGAQGAVVEGEGGYKAILSIPLDDAAIGDTIQLDVRVTDDATTDGWNTAGVTGTVTLVEALSHTDVPEAAVAPAIDGTLDPVWSTSSSVQTLKQVSGTDGAIGTFHLLWKGQTLYVYAEVADPTVDTTGSDPWIQDSIEMYLDAGNSKNGSYRYDDTQIRINADGAISFGTGDETFQANRVQSSAKRVDGGYVVEAAISLLEYGGLGSIQGLDVQVNDATGGARTAIRNWADPTGTGYQTSARWGVASLVEGTLIAQDAFTPKLSGSAVVGTTLKVTGLPAGSTLSYQWLRNGVAIAGATASTYKLGTADAGKKISVQVTSVRAGYVDRTETSAQSATVLKTFTKTTSPSISGTVKVGAVVKAKVSAWSPSASYSYQWYSNGKAIKGATKSSFKITRSQAGTTLTVKVTGKRSGYVPVTKASAGKKVPLLTLTVDRSKLNGPTRVGGVLRVTAGASHPVSTVKTYQWKANGKAISGATKSTYTVKRADLGKRITVSVTYRAQGFATKVVVVGPTYRIAAR
ncbi:endo-1,4-beta-xylanase [Demequina sp.]|uniref:endo-1,4-beta-xylanase n=1 Tax=Demequina sp. TaxID=2050685 RepID=UPI003D10696A